MPLHSRGQPLGSMLMYTLMIYRFIDDQGTFTVKNPHNYSLYFPLTDKKGGLLSSISPNLAGDIKKDNDRFLMPPASISDLKNNLLCRRDFFIKINGPKRQRKLIRLSEPADDTLEAGLLYHKLIKKTDSCLIEILNFIPHNLAVEVMRIKIINRSRQDLQITPTSLIPLYGRSADNLRDHRHVSGLLNRISLNKHGIFLRPTMTFSEKGHKPNKDTYFCLSFEGGGTAPLGQFPTLDYFCGRTDLLNPQAIQKNLLPTTKKKAEFDGKEATAAFRFRNKRLKKGQAVDYFLIMGIDSRSNSLAESERRIMRIFTKLGTSQRVEKSLKETKKHWHNYLSRLNFDFKNNNFNNWLLWVKLQPTLRKLFGCSFLPHFDYGKGGRGWRDLWQDALALILNEPREAKEMILKNFQGVRIDGSNATIIAKKGGFISDRNNISRVWMDHGVWPYLTLRLYMNKTGDVEILKKETTYFRDHLTMRAKEIDQASSQKDYLLRTKKGKIYKGSVLERILIEHLSAFFNVGKHNIIRLDSADWNDGLDMAAERGESVAFSFMYTHNLTDLCLYLRKMQEKNKEIYLLEESLILLDRLKKPVDYDKFKAKQKRLDQYLKSVKEISGKRIKIKLADLIYDLEEKYKHYSRWLSRKEWLNPGFFNGYYDNRGRRTEGNFGTNTQVMLASQVFPIMSKIPSPKQVRQIWNSIQKYLKSPKLGGFCLNTKFPEPYFDLGRAFSFAYGDKENGAFFNHMAVLLSYSLYGQGFIKEGRQVLNSIYNMASSSRSEIYPMIPEYFNAQGQGLYYYLTGSAGWYVYTLIEAVLGIKFILGDIALEPRLTADNFAKKTIEFTFSWANKKIHLIYINNKTKKGVLKIKKVFLESNEIKKQNGSYCVKRQDLRRIPQKSIQIKIYLA